MVLVRALIFDMDGVLLDSNPWHQLAWREFRVQHGLAIPNDGFDDWMYGRRNDEIIRRLFGETLTEGEIRRLGHEKEELFRARMRRRVAEAAVAGVADFLRSYGHYPAAVASNAETANIEFVLDELGLRDCFRTVVSGSDVSQPKPSPEIYLLAAARLGFAPEECLVFEDSATGLTAARNADMLVVGLSTTHTALPGADLVVEDFQSPRLTKFLAGVLAPCNENA